MGKSYFLFENYIFIWLVIYLLYSLYYTLYSKVIYRIGFYNMKFDVVFLSL